MKKSGKSAYIPERGDIIKFDFNPQKGREQAGYRPAIVISPQKFNRISSLVFVCPITSKVKGFSFEVLLSESRQIQGAILTHHLRSIDWRERKIKFVEKASSSVVEEVAAKLKPLIL